MLFWSPELLPYHFRKIWRLSLDGRRFLSEVILNELQALLQLSSVPYLGSIRIQFLIRHFGSAIKALQATQTELRELPGFSDRLVQAWKQAMTKEFWKNAIDQAEKRGIEIIPYFDDTYPKRLLDLPDYPILLYVKGELQPKDQKMIAIVGTRQATVYGLEMAQQISMELARAGFTIVSGLAKGIDTVAHEAAIRWGRSLAVLGSGLGHIYPKENEGLSDKIVSSGAIMSEYAIDTPPEKHQFPQRNRIVSGMTMATILIEAPRQSGAMLTMDRAFQQGRMTFALPGRADIENFKGNHELIKTGRAILVEDAYDVMSLVVKKSSKEYPSEVYKNFRMAESY